MNRGPEDGYQPERTARPMGAPREEGLKTRPIKLNAEEKNDRGKLLLAGNALTEAMNKLINPDGTPNKALITAMKAQWLTDKVSPEVQNMQGIMGSVVPALLNLRTGAAFSDSEEKWISSMVDPKLWTDPTVAIRNIHRVMNEIDAKAQGLGINLQDPDSFSEIVKRAHPNRPHQSWLDYRKSNIEYGDVQGLDVGAGELTPIEGRTAQQTQLIKEFDLPDNVTDDDVLKFADELERLMAEGMTRADAIVKAKEVLGGQ